MKVERAYIASVVKQCQDKWLFVEGIRDEHLYNSLYGSLDSSPLHLAGTMLVWRTYFALGILHFHCLLFGNSFSLLKANESTISRVASVAQNLGCCQKGWSCPGPSCYHHCVSVIVQRAYLESRFDWKLTSKEIPKILFGWVLWSGWQKGQYDLLSVLASCEAVSWGRSYLKRCETSWRVAPDEKRRSTSILLLSRGTGIHPAVIWFN